MEQEYFTKISDLARKAQEPLQAMIELNVRTLQGFNYLKPEELTQIRKPEELLEKQIELSIANSHKALDYMQKSFQIMEKAMLSFVQETKETTNKMKQ